MGAGTLTVYQGTSTGLSAMSVGLIQGANAGNGLGVLSQVGGDVNGDGYADLIVSGPSASPGGRAGAGTLFVVHGNSTGFGSPPARVLDGPTMLENFWVSIARVEAPNLVPAMAFAPFIDRWPTALRFARRDTRANDVVARASAAGS